MELPECQEAHLWLRGEWRDILEEESMGKCRGGVLSVFFHLGYGDGCTCMYLLSCAL